MAGTLYGIGMGPGDPSLMTVGGAMTIRRCEYLAIPGENPTNTEVFDILVKLDPMMDLHLDGKVLMGISMPMTKDPKKLEESHKKGAMQIIEQLDKGNDVAFLTLGDPTIYSTYMYIHEQVHEKGYETKIISGVTSFCAAAGKVGLHLGSKDEQIHIVPASYEVEEALKLSGTKIFMKAGRQYGRLRQILTERYGKDATKISGKNLVEKSENCGELNFVHEDNKVDLMEDVMLENKGELEKVIMVENCGMGEEHIYYGIENFPEQAGYYTIIFVKDGM